MGDEQQMTTAYPDLPTLLKRLSECPAEFLLPPRTGDRGVIHVDAVVSDLLVVMGGEPLPAHAAPWFVDPPDDTPKGWQSVVLVACWLLADPWFVGKPRLAPKASILLASELQPLVRLVKAEALIADPDRREELVRVCLARLGLRPDGETETAAQDRLTAISSVERERVAREAAIAERRAREVRKAMAAKRAQEAASVYGRE